jgi:hypothetical protein
MLVVPAGAGAVYETTPNVNRKLWLLTIDFKCHSREVLGRSACSEELVHSACLRCCNGADLLAAHPHIWPIVLGISTYQKYCDLHRVNNNSQMLRSHLCTAATVCYTLVLLAAEHVCTAKGQQQYQQAASKN